MWSSPSVGAAGRLVRPAYRTPFEVNRPTIWGRATAARTARRLWPHSTIWQYGWVEYNDCAVSCRFPPRPTRSLRSLREVGGSTLNYADTDVEIRSNTASSSVSRSIFTRLLRTLLSTRVSYSSLSFASRSSADRKPASRTTPRSWRSSLNSAGLDPAISAARLRLTRRSLPLRSWPQLGR